MPTLEDLKSSFSRNLDAQRLAHAARLEAELQILRDQLWQSSLPPLPVDPSWLGGALTSPRKSPGPPRLPKVPRRVDLTTSSVLQEMDAAFIQAFDVENFYPVERLAYPTVYCETLEEFFTPLAQQMDISSQARQALVQQMAEQAQQTAAQTDGGGTFGFNLPGVGCYLNGWLFAYGSGLSPQAAFQQTRLQQRILGTAAHEKLGHGFLSLYSALGAVKTSLGLSLADLARRFSLQSADDPQSSLRREQANLLYTFSQLLEEGWATWVEGFLAGELLGASAGPRYELSQVIAAIQDLPVDVQNRHQVQDLLMGALAALFSRDDVPLGSLHQAVMVFDVVGSEFDDYFFQALGQPLRYVIGELLFHQAETNLGTACLPYAALLAANITFDPAQISLADLRDLFSHDPRLNPDARLAALCRLVLSQPGALEEFTRRAEAELSFSVPKELKS